MRIQCPFCGERDSSEFLVGGDASFARVGLDAPGAEARFVQAVYLRSNPAGLHVELWYHASGCRGWLQVTRDTRTHEVFAVALVNEAARS